MRLVIDTNILVSAAAASGLCRSLIRTGVLQHIVVTSEPLLREFRETLRRKFSLVPEDFSFFKELHKRAEKVRPAPLSPPICRDKDDDWVLATALTGRADIIITGDDDLLALKTHRGIRILSPRAFLELTDRLPN